MCKVPPFVKSSLILNLVVVMENMQSPHVWCTANGYVYNFTSVLSKLCVLRFWYLYSRVNITG